jgi:hypothetical protein
MFRAASVVPRPRLRRLRSFVLAVALCSAALGEGTGRAQHVEAREARPTALLTTSASAELAAVGKEIDAQLADAAQDLGLRVDVGVHAIAKRTDADLLAEAKSSGRVIVAPSLRALPGSQDVELHLVLAPPNGRALRVRTERAAREDASVRAVVMLRDLVADLDEGRARAAGPLAAPGVAPSPVAPPKSAGRAILVANAAIYGGLVGYSIQRSSGSDDPRLLYPLLAVGAGVGLGGSIVVAEEWDVGAGDAWFLSAGAWWPTLASHLIYEGRFGPSADTQGFSSSRFTFGLIGGSLGIGISAFDLWLSRGMGEGGAVLAHSGGGFGLVLGGLAELGARGDVNRTPFAGMGYGAAIGWLVTSGVATQFELAPSRVLFVDLGAFLGGLGGAALASPFLFGEKTVGRQRAFVGITGASVIAGAGAALWATREPRRASATFPLRGAPTVIALTPIGLEMPVGLGWSGLF